MMAWATPKTNWKAGDAPNSGDFNRIEENTRIIGAYTELTESATYYVSTSGNDNNPGTQSSPFATIDKAFNMVKNKYINDATIYLTGTGPYAMPEIKGFLPNRLLIRSTSIGTKVNISSNIIVSGMAGKTIEFVALKFMYANCWESGIIMFGECEISGWAQFTDCLSVHIDNARAVTGEINSIYSFRDIGTVYVSSGFVQQTGATIGAPMIRCSSSRITITNVTFTCSVSSSDFAAVEINSGGMAMVGGSGNITSSRPFIHSNGSVVIFTGDKPTSAANTKSAGGQIFAS